MKKHLASLSFFLCVLFFGVLPLRAETVQSIPNPLRTNRGWVSDNANVIDAAQETQINRAIESYNNQTGGEIVAVTVQDTNGEVPKEFATELFNHWKIGKQGKDNGVLILLVMGKRRLEIETGYGAEGDLPDGKVGEIRDQYALPAFKRGDFGGGVLATTNAIIKALGGTPLTANNSQDAPPTSNPRRVPSTNQPTFNQPYNPPYDSPAPRGSSPFDLVLGLFMLLMVPVGLGVLAWGFVAVFRQLATRKCQMCGRDMKRLDEDAEDVFLSSDQQFEERLGGLDYKVWQCEACNVCHIERSARWLSNVKECPRCQHYTMQVTSETVQQPTYYSTGLRETTEVCQYPNCGHVTRLQQIIPRREREVVIVSGGSYHHGSSNDSSWGGSWGSGSSGGSSGDSGFSSSSSDFGGGSSGGGGAGGDW